MATRRRTPATPPATPGTTPPKKGHSVHHLSLGGLTIISLIFIAKSLYDHKKHGMSIGYMLGTSIGAGIAYFFVVGIILLLLKFGTTHRFDKLAKKDTEMRLSIATVAFFIAFLTLMFAGIYAIHHGSINANGVFEHSDFFERTVEKAKLVLQILGYTCLVLIFLFLCRAIWGLSHTWVPKLLKSWAFWGAVVAIALFYWFMFEFKDDIQIKDPAKKSYEDRNRSENGNDHKLKVYNGRTHFEQESPEAKAIRESGR